MRVQTLDLTFHQGAYGAQTWTARSSPQSNNWRSAAWAPEIGRVVAISNNGTNRVITSDDAGNSWTLRSAAAANNWRSVCWSPQLRLFCAVAQDGTTRVMTSPDGMTWTGRTAAEANSWNAVAWSPQLGIFCAVAESGTNRVMTSTDGITWTARAAAEANSWNDVSWSPKAGIFCAVSGSGTNRVMTSTDGITWTARAAAEANFWNAVAWSPQLGIFCAVADSGTNRVMTSPDGITWTARNGGAGFSGKSITWSAGTGSFLAAGSGGVFLSPNGTDWNSEPGISSALSSVWLPQQGRSIVLGTNLILTRDVLTRGFFATSDFTTKPGDTPASTMYPGRLKDAGAVKRTLFSERMTSGASAASIGDMRLTNTDGVLDTLAQYGFDGREAVLRGGEHTAAYPTGFTVLATGTIAAMESGLDEAVIKFRDNLELLRVPLLQNKYLGNNSLPNGLEGVTGDIKGQFKPRIWGVVNNITPVLVNTSRLIYQAHDGALSAISAVYDGGLALSAGTAYTSQADMEANAPSAGQYRAWLSGGYFRLGSSPARQVTCDASRNIGASPYNDAAQILNDMAVFQDVNGPAPLSISASDVSALKTLQPAPLGIFVTGETTILQAMDQVAASIGAWYGFDRLGVLRMGRLDAPGGTPAAEIGAPYILRIARVPSRDEAAGIPAFRVKVNHDRNWTVQTTDLNGAVTAARRGYLAQEWRSVTSEDLGVKERHLLSPEISRDSLITVGADASDEAARLLALYKAEREIYEVDLKMNDALITACELGAVVNITYPRFTLASGKKFVIIGQDADFNRNFLTLTVWG